MAERDNAQDAPFSEALVCPKCTWTIGRLELCHRRHHANGTRRSFGDGQPWRSEHLDSICGRCGFIRTMLTADTHDDTRTWVMGEYGPEEFAAPGRSSVEISSFQIEPFLRRVRRWTRYE